MLDIIDHTYEVDLILLLPTPYSLKYQGRTTSLLTTATNYNVFYMNQS
ncbi:MAG: hypothetical protein F6K55_32160 [Moorea sp. SIO4A3]|nr:hypothetical protein [Moorena sp. SIO4A3]